MKGTLQNQWANVKNQIKQKWNKLTDQDLDQINGNRDQLLSKIQQRYGLPKDKVEAELSTFENSCGCGSKGGSCASGHVHQKKQ